MYFVFDFFCFELTCQEMKIEEIMFKQKLQNIGTFETSKSGPPDILSCNSKTSKTLTLHI